MNEYMGPNSDGEGEDWVSKADLEALRMDRQYLVGLTGSGPEQALSILKEASPAAAMQIVKLALHAESEATKLRASQYILDHTVGETGGASDPWEGMREKVVKDIDTYLAEVGKNGPPKDTS